MLFIDASDGEILADETIASVYLDEDEESEFQVTYCESIVCTEKELSVVVVSSSRRFN